MYGTKIKKIDCNGNIFILFFQIKNIKEYFLYINLKTNNVSKAINTEINEKQPNKKI